jgi:diaminobutyrate-2-oxoglutarate transaminase
MERTMKAPTDITAARGLDPHRFDKLHFDTAPQVSPPIPGPRSRALLEEQAELESRARSYPRSVPLGLEEGRGATIRDVDGNTFVDLFGGAGTLNVGHANPAVLAAAADQQQRLVHALDFPTKPKLRLLRKLKELLPGRLRRTGRFHLPGPTGTDAVEAALKLARSHTQRSGVIAFQGSYHGMAVTSDLSYARPEATPVQYMPYPYCYRCPLGLKRESCGLACARLVETAIEDPHSGTPRPAAVLMEPIQGEGGTIIPPAGYLAEIRRITREHEIPLIFDEIQSGFGRTGAMFACEHDGVTPDVMTLSKALGGIGYPLSAVAFDDELDSWEPGAHIGTFRGHQVAMAAGDAAIDFMRETDLVGHTAALGAHAVKLLGGAASELTSIGEVRGRGLMIGVELVRDLETREPWPELASEVRSLCCERGAIIEVGGHYGNVARFLPPLVITRELLERGVEIFLDAVRELELTPSRHKAPDKPLRIVAPTS